MAAEAHKFWGDGDEIFEVKGVTPPKVIGFGQFVYCLWTILLFFLDFSFLFFILLFSFSSDFFRGVSPSLKILGGGTCPPVSTACGYTLHSIYNLEGHSSSNLLFSKNRLFCRHAFDQFNQPIPQFSIFFCWYLNCSWSWKPVWGTEQNAIQNGLSSKLRQWFRNPKNDYKWYFLCPHWEKMESLFVRLPLLNLTWHIPNESLPSISQII